MIPAVVFRSRCTDEDLRMTVSGVHAAGSGNVVRARTRSSGVDRCCGWREIGRDISAPFRRWRARKRSRNRTDRMTCASLSKSICQAFATRIRIFKADCPWGGVMPHRTVVKSIRASTGRPRRFGKDRHGLIWVRIKPPLSSVKALTGRFVGAGSCARARTTSC
jgi:hypothetical protein